MNQMNFFITYLWKEPMFFLAAIIIVVFRSAPMNSCMPGSRCCRATAPPPNADT